MASSSEVKVATGDAASDLIFDAVRHSLDMAAPGLGSSIRLAIAATVARCLRGKLVVAEPEA